MTDESISQSWDAYINVNGDLYISGPDQGFGGPRELVVPISVAPDLLGEARKAVRDHLQELLSSMEGSEE